MGDFSPRRSVPGNEDGGSRIGRHRFRGECEGRTVIDGRSGSYRAPSNPMGASDAKSANVIGNGAANYHQGLRPTRRDARPNGWLHTTVITEDAELYLALEGRVHGCKAEWMAAH